jgi:hypothetical protein
MNDLNILYVFYHGDPVLIVCVRRSQGSWLTVPGPGFLKAPA